MYDAAIEIFHAIWKNGLTISALGTAVYVLLKQRKVKRRMKRYIPWLFSEDGDVRDYEQRQIRIESKIDFLIERSGGTWNGPGTISNSTDHRNLKKLYASSQMVMLQLYIIGRKMKMNKLKSRKFWIAIVTAGLLVAKDGLGIEVESETIMAFAGIVITWLIGESAVDASRAKAAATKETEGGTNNDQEYQITESNK